MERCHIYLLSLSSFPNLDFFTPNLEALILLKIQLHNIHSGYG